MSFERPLSGGCLCGRNRYVVEVPKHTSSADEIARVLFDSNPSHRMAHASPLSAFLRVPLSWYHSATFAFFPDETNAMIRRTYTSPHEQHAKRHFCGFCGTPLSFWSEQPRSEADFIQVALGSLSSVDLADLEDLGLLPDSDEEQEEVVVPNKDADMTGPEEVMVYSTGRETVGRLPWFDTLMAGSRLGNMRSVRGTSKSHNGNVRVEWEVTEWIEDSDNAASSGKRKFEEVGGSTGHDSRRSGDHH